MKPIPTVLLLIEESRAYGRGLLRGISDYVHINRPWIFLMNPDPYSGGGKHGNTIERLKEGSIDGVIIREDKKVIQKVIDLNLPTVVACHISTQQDLPLIITDCNAIGQMAAKYFLDHGFKHFAFCGIADTFWSHRREESFRNVISKSGHTVHSYQQPRAKKYRSWKEEQPFLIKWLEELPKPIAIMTCTDDRAIDVIDICEMTNIKVPEEVAVLGVDDDDLVCRMASVSLSSVALNTEKAGYEAAELLDRLMSGEEIANQEITVQPTHITTRRSTDIYNIEDEYVAKAVNFIHTNVNEPLQVIDIEKAVLLSGRNLYDHFKKELGRTVIQEITRIRIEKICRLLEDTSLSIVKIAQIMGFAEDKHLSRYFSRQKKMSPMAWRKHIKGPVK